MQSKVFWGNTVLASRLEKANLYGPSRRTALPYER